MAFKVPSGHSKIHFSTNFEHMNYCGILPAIETNIKTSGLLWDLGEAPWDKTSMTTQISSSNKRDKDEVEVWCDKDIAFISTLKKEISDC